MSLLVAVILNKQKAGKKNKKKLQKAAFSELSFILMKSDAMMKRLLILAARCFYQLC